jgi:hypothetical protein
MGYRPFLIYSCAAKGPSWQLSIPLSGFGGIISYVKAGRVVTSTLSSTRRCVLPGNQMRVLSMTNVYGPLLWWLLEARDPPPEIAIYFWRGGSQSGQAVLVALQFSPGGPHASAFGPFVTLWCLTARQRYFCYRLLSVHGAPPLPPEY